MASPESKKYPGISGPEACSMRKRAFETRSVKKGTVVDRVRHISKDPAMRKLKKLYKAMTPEEQRRITSYLNHYEGNNGTVNS